MRQVSDPAVLHAFGGQEPPRLAVMPGAAQVVALVHDAVGRREVRDLQPRQPGHALPVHHQVSQQLPLSRHVDLHRLRLVAETLREYVVAALVVRIPCEPQGPVGRTGQAWTPMLAGAD